MANPTTYFGWVMPTSTDLVTDLPADFNVFGQGVDTSMQDLLGGTTGQILSKTSGTNMDFTWINNDQGDITGVTAGNGISVTSPTGPVPTVAIDTTVTVDKTTAQTLTNKTLTSPALTTPTISTATTNGDLIYGTGSGALQRLGIGSSAQVLTVASGIPSWATPATAVSGLTPIGTTQTFTTSSAVNVNNVFSATYKNYRVIINITASGATSVDQQLRWRVSGTDASSNDYYYSTVVANESTVTGNGASAATQFMLSNNGTIGVIYIILDIFQPFVATRTDLLWQAVNVNATYRGAAGNHNGATSYDGFSIIPASSNITGSVTCYGYSN